MAKSKKNGPQHKVIAENRKARFNYEIVEDWEAGICLTGSEVKSMRTGKVSIAESHAVVEGGEVWLLNSHIAPYKQAGKFGHESNRARKLLLHQREIQRIIGAVQTKGMTLVALSLYFNARGFAKVKLALAKGKKLHDKRETEKKRDWERQKARIMRDS